MTTAHTLIERTLGQRILDRLFRGKAIILYGPRQSGKTTLMQLLLENRKEKTLFLDGDEPDIRGLLSGATSTQLRSLFGDHKIVCIDEAQRINNVGLTLKIITDKIKDVQVIATGSSALDLASKTSESLTGRKYEFMLYPFSFAEMVASHGLLEEKRSLEHRLIFGYYPEVVNKQGEEEETLKLLAGSYLYKDLLMLGQVSKPFVMEKLVKALSLQVGSEVSYSEIGRLVEADKETVERYVDLLEKAFVVFRLPAFSRNVRNEIRKGKKIYFYDNGIRNAVIGNYNPAGARTDKGALWENFLISERMKHLRNSGIDVARYFWRTAQQQEIDYLEERVQRLHAFEFKWSGKSRLRIPKTFTVNYPEAVTKLVTTGDFESFLGC